MLSLGCAKNLVDAECLLGFLRRHGLTLTRDLGQAEAVIINTCSFIKSAKEESIEHILQIAALKRKGQLRRVIVTGCLVQEHGSALAAALPEVDAFIGIGELEPLLAALKSPRLEKDRPVIYYRKTPDNLPDHNSPRLRLTPAYSAYLKICDGCDNCCSYCLIPGIRGRLRSRRQADIIAEGRALAKSGVREINLIGQDITQYGTDRYGHRHLAPLLRDLVKIRGLKWLRLLYAHPAHLDREVIKLIAAEEKICKYIDLPLQHINEDILRRMNRKTGRAQIEKIISLIRREIPEVTLRTTFIVGFPGETERQFRELREFIRNTRFDRLGVFTYSREPNTPAAAFTGQVPENVKQARFKELMSLQQELALARNRELIGQTREILIEKKAGPGLFGGRSQGDAPDIDNLVTVRSRRALRPGEFIPVKITEVLPYDLIGGDLEPC